MADNEKELNPAESGSTAEYSVIRPILHTVDLQNAAGYTKDFNKPRLRNYLASLTALSVLHSLLPITYWLPRYDVKHTLINDLISGFTVAVMHIPQGMAYGILALVTPEVGLYMAFFPVLVYLVFGTSRHASLGTFAVISIMVSKVVQVNTNDDSEQSSSPLEVVTTLCFVVGLYHLAMFVCRMGALSSLLSEPLVSGFTTGAAVHVFVNQFKDILGVSVTRFKGPFKLIYSVIDLGSKAPEANVTALIISSVLILIMVSNNELLKPKVAKLCRFPIPIELMVVIGGTLLSKFMKLNENYEVKLVGPIPTGLPAPKLPKFSLIPAVAMDGLGIAIVSYSVLMSMAKTFARKHTYEVHPNQELLATGLANIVGSFFSCMPTGCALARSVIQEQTGGKTQIASLVSASLILLVILFIGPVFEVLPRCVLSSIIVVALKAMLFQVLNVKKFYRQDPLEAITWIVTFLTVVLIDIDIGLLCGVAMSLFSLYMRGMRNYSCTLGVVPGTDIYVDLKSHANAQKVRGVAIFRHCGGINFTSAAGVKKQMYEQLEVKEMLRNGGGSREEEKLKGSDVKAVIFDISCVPLVDFPACKTLLGIRKELSGAGVKFLLTGANDRVYDVLMGVSAMEREEIDILVSVEDAVLSVNNIAKEANDEV